MPMTVKSTTTGHIQKEQIRQSIGNIEDIPPVWNASVFTVIAMCVFFV